VLPKSNFTFGSKQKIFWILFLGLMVADQLIKFWTRTEFAANLDALGGKPLPGVFELTLTYNKGIAFGMLQGHGIFLAPVAIIMAGFAIYFSMKNNKDPLIIHIAFALLAAGALGNLFDRLVNGKVTDMFYFRLINFPVFNLADACITVAAFLLIFTWSFDSAKKIETKPPAANPAPIEPT